MRWLARRDTDFPEFRSTSCSAGTIVLCGPRDPLLTDSPTYLALADTLLARMAAHRSILAQGVPDEILARIRAKARSGGVIGSDRFRREIATMLRVRVPGAPRGRPRKRDD